MGKKILAILDSEPEYSKRLCEYIEEKSIYPFEVIHFTNVETLLMYEKTNIDILVISKEIYIDEIEDKKINKVLFLVNDNEKENEICRFQTAEKILRDIMSNLESDVPVLVRNKQKTKLVGLYTPVHRSLQTTFAITMGQILSKNHKTLYLNFESYSGFCTKLQRTYNMDMSDLLYLLNSQSSGLFFKFQSIIDKIGNMDYIPPLSSIVDLHQVRSDQWLKLLDYIETNMDYEYIVLDLGDSIDGLLHILNNCDYIFTPIKEDSIAMAKIEQYENMLNKMNMSKLSEKMRKIRIPIFKAIPIEYEQLTHSEIAEYTKKIINEVIYGS